ILAMPIEEPARAKVDQNRPLAAPEQRLHDDVARLVIAMHDACALERDQSEQEPASQGVGLIDGEPALVEDGRQGRARDDLLHEHAAILAVVDEIESARHEVAADAVQHLRLALEASNQLGIGGRFWEQVLERNPLARASVDSQPDCSDTPSGYRARN